MERWWWALEIDHHRKMQAACIAHGDLEGAKIYRQAIESEEQWLANGRPDEPLKSELAQRPNG
jgi:hypothetical protein